MTISAIPDFPAIGDASFNSKAYAYATHMAGTWRTEANALESAVNADEAATAASAAAAALSEANAAASAASAAAYDNATGTSTTSMAISVATGKAFTTQAGRTWVAGMSVIAYCDATNYMTCTVASYVGTTLTLDCISITGSGTYAVWSIYPLLGVQKLPMLCPASAALNAVTPLGDWCTTHLHTFGSTSLSQVIRSSTHFILVQSASTTTISTSPDGITWTGRGISATAGTWVVRALPSSANCFAYISGATTCAYSTDGGVVWTAGTAMPISPTFENVTMSSSGVVAIWAAGTTNYVSNDFGVTWSAAQTMPTASGGGWRSVGGLILFGVNSTYYTSATGLTGSWTARSLPGSFSHFFTGSYVNNACDATTPTLSISPTSGQTGAGYTIRTTTDGINWTDTGISLAYSTGPYIPFKVNGVWMQGSEFASGTGYSYSRHGTGWVLRRNSGDSYPNQQGHRVATNGTVWVAVNGGVSYASVMRYDSASPAVSYFAP